MQAVGADTVGVATHRRRVPDAAAVGGVCLRAIPLVAPRVAPLGLAVHIPAGGLLPLRLAGQPNDLALRQLSSPRQLPIQPRAVVVGIVPGDAHDRALGVVEARIIPIAWAR